jgi:hypothetical protein
MSETEDLIDDNCQNIFIKVILIGPYGVGRKSLINKINQIKCHKSLNLKIDSLNDISSNVIRYIFSNIKISFIFFIPTLAEEYEGLENELSSSDEDIELCNQYRIKFTSMKKEIKQILALFMHSNNVNTLNYFAFLYDLSDFDKSFRELLIYFKSVNRKYKIKDKYPVLLFGTKVDKKKQPKDSKIKELNSFMDSFANVKQYEIGIKSNFDFNHFFSEFANYTLTYQGVVSKSHINQIMEKIEQKQNFSKAPKFEKPQESISPGPAKYLNNIYDTENMQERIEALTGNKRFNTKLFINKKGPQLHEENIINKREDPFNKFRNKYEIEQKAKLQKVAEYLMGEKKGFSFGGGGIVTGNGKKLLEERKKKAEIRNELYYSAFSEPSIFYKPKTKNKSNERYEYNEITEDNKSIRSKESKVTQGRYSSLVKENKSKILKENEDRNKIIMERNRKLSSEERNKLKEKYKDIIFGNNSAILKRTDEKIKEIQQSREREKSPPMYDVSKSLLDKNKGFSIISRRPQIDKRINNAPYVYIQSEFDKYANNIKLGSISYTKRHSIKPITVENNKKEFDEEKFNKYAINRLNSERYQNTMEFLNDRKQKENMHNALMSELKEQEDLYYKNLKASTSNNEFDIINYNLVESSSPKYSMRGKYDIDENRENKLLLFGNYAKTNLMSEPKKYEPNYDYIKPKIRSFKFSKDERFKTNKSESNLNQGPLFTHDNYGLSDKKDYQVLETYDYQDKRPPFAKIDANIPGPGNYYIKGFAEEIVDKAKARSIASAKRSANVSKSDITSSNRDNNEIEN